MINIVATLLIVAAGLNPATPAIKPTHHVDLNDPAYRSALGALGVAIGCDRAFADEHIITLARELLIGALRHQDTPDLYRTADKIIAQLRRQPINADQEVIFTAERCENAKLGLMGAVR